MAEEVTCCTDCDSTNIKKVKYPIANGNYQVRFQCQDCGKLDGRNQKHTPLDAKRDWYSPELVEKWKNKKDTERRKIREEKENDFYFSRLETILRALYGKEYTIRKPKAFRMEFGIIEMLLPCITDFEYNIVDSYISEDDIMIVKCPKCNTISFVWAGGNWACPECGAYDGDHYTAGFLNYEVKRYKGYIEEGYQWYLNSDQWKDKREEAFIVHGKRCAYCGSIHNLNVHHKTYENVLNEDVVNDLMVLCQECHEKLHKVLKGE